MLFSFPYLVFLLKFAKSGFVNHPPHFDTHLRMVVLSCLFFFFFKSKSICYWSFLLLQPAEFFWPTSFCYKTRQGASDLSQKYAIVPVTVCRFMFPIKLMPVVLMEYDWNAFWRDGEQYCVLLMAPAQYRNPICLKSIIIAGTLATWRQYSDIWLAAILQPSGTHVFCCDQGRWLTCSFEDRQPCWH